MNTKKDFGNFIDNVIALRCYKRFRSATDFARYLKVDEKRYAEVENKRLHPDESLIAAIEKEFGFKLIAMKTGHIILGAQMQYP